MATVLNPIISTTLVTSQIPIILDTEPDAEYVVLYSVYVENLTSTDVVIVKAQFQVQGLFRYYVGIGRTIIRASSASATTGTHVCHGVMSNLQPGNQNEAVVLSGIDSNISSKHCYYNVLGYSKGSSLLHAGQSLEVTAGSGDCTAVVFDRS